MRNPLAILFGSCLRVARKRLNYSSDQTAKNIFGSPRSTYRKIEAGIIILHSRYAMSLCRTTEFGNWRFGEITRMLSAAEYLESKLTDTESLNKGIQEIGKWDSSLYNLINKHLPVDLDADNVDEKLKISFSTEIAVGDCLEYLLQSEQARYLRPTYDKFYENIQGNSLCILSPINHDLLDKFRVELDAMGSIEERFQELKIKVQSISKVDLSFPSTSSKEWRIGRNFKGMLGILHQHENLRNENILDSHSDNFNIIYSNKNNRITYVIISNDQLEAEKSIEDYYNIVWKQFQGQTDLEFQDIKSRIIFHILHPEQDKVILDKLDLAKDNQELWMYNESSTPYIYAFKGVLQEDSKGTGYAEYTILKNREIQDCLKILNEEISLNWKFNLIKSK